MPVKKEREYRTLVAPLAAQSSGEKRLQSECYVEGYYQEVRERENHKRAVTKEHTELDGTRRTRRQL